MTRIAVIIDDLFDDSEYQEPVDAFRNAGYEIFHIGIKAKNIVTGKKTGTKVIIDQDVKNSKPQDFDALLIPGGYSPDKLRANEEAVAFVKQFMVLNKPVFIICHGVQLLVSAQVLTGRKVTCWKSVIQDVKNADADFIDNEVVVDGNLVSSRHPGDLPAFIKAALKILRQ